MKQIAPILLVGFLIGWFAQEIYNIGLARAAAKQSEYMVQRVLGKTTEILENSLNTQASKGWKLHSYSAEGGVVIFER
jgi:hypothetical protein